MKSCTFLAERIVQTKPFALQAKPLVSWFQQAEAVEMLFGKAESVETFEDGVYKAVVPMTTFPGIAVTSSNYFTVTVDEPAESLAVTMLNSTTTALGPPLLVRIFEASQNSMQTTSRNDITVVSDTRGNRIQSDVMIRLDMTIPDWVPVPVKQMEKSGSEALQKLIDSDVAPVLEQFKDRYLTW